MLRRQAGSGSVGETQQQESWAALRMHDNGRSVELGISAVRWQIRGGEKGGGEGRQSLKPFPKWMNEWVTHIMIAVMI